LLYVGKDFWTFFQSSAFALEEEMAASTSRKAGHVCPA
jgi:hypothetical protein